MSRTSVSVDTSLWLSPSGRIPRSTFWLYFALPAMVFGLLAAGVDAAMGADPTNSIAEAVRASFGDTYLSISAFAGPVSNVTLLLYLWPVSVGCVKRLHDLGLSGWLWPAYLVIAIGCWGYYLAAPGSGPGIALVILASLFGFAMSLYIYFIPGTSGPNQYGPDPLEQSS